MWCKSLGHNVTIKYRVDTRLFSVEIIKSSVKLFIICIYLPTCSNDNYDIVDDVETANVVIIGDFNSNLGTLFGNELDIFCRDNNLHILILKS